MIENLQTLVNQNERLVRRGRFVSTTFLLEIGDIPYLIKVDEGRIASVIQGPFVMPSWTFALRATRETWSQFWLNLPPPGSHDLFALIKRRALRAEGNLQPFMSNIFYFKGVMTAVRSTSSQEAGNA